MPPLRHHIMLYCERTHEGVWGEPLNTLSSLGFFIAAWLLWKMYTCYRSASGGRPAIPVLIGITLAIGAGSALFHSVSTMWAALFDVIPILIFALYYIYLFGRVLLQWSGLRALALCVAFAVVNLVYKYYVFRAIDGYVSYIPTFFFLLALTLMLLLKRHPSCLRMASACAVAFVSLCLRAVDRDWCAVFPFGTHFLWHLLNAWLIYMLVRELIIDFFRPDTWKPLS